MLVRTAKEQERMYVYGPDGTLLGYVTLVELGAGRARLGYTFPQEYRLVPGKAGAPVPELGSELPVR